MKSAFLAFTASIALITTNAHAWNVAEFYYSMNANNIQPLSSGVNPLLFHTGSWTLPDNGKAFISAVNIANNSTGSTFAQFSPNIWSGAQWTGLDPLDRTPNSQSGLSYGGAIPSYGNNVIQVDGGKVGLFVNTWGLIPPNPALTSGMQFFRYFFTPKIIWSTSDNTSQFCVNGIIDLHSWQGANVQAMVTTAFTDATSNKTFFLNVMMLDTNAAHPTIERVMGDNPLDTGNPIAFSYFQSQFSKNPLNRYTNAIPDYGAILENYQQTPTKAANSNPNPKHYGFCISKSQFSNILQDIRMNWSQYSNNPSDYRLGVVIFSPEIAGSGTVGMTIHAANAYRLTP